VETSREASDKSDRIYLGIGRVQAKGGQRVVVEYSKTQTSILDVAQELSQTRGFNGFSYRDIADRIGIRTASIHHHFRTKHDLGTAMTHRYRSDFMAAVAALETDASDPFERLRSYAMLFMATLEAGRMCLCGTLAVEYETLPQSMQTEVRAFFVDNERWIEGVLKAAQEHGQLAVSDTPRELAATFLSTLEGTMMSIRALGEARRFVVVVDQLLERLKLPADTTQSH